MRIFIQSPRAVFFGAQVAEQNCGGIVIENGFIKEILARGEKPAATVQETFDAGGLVALPGLINTHHHFYQTLTRAMPGALNKELFAWLKSLYPIWSRLDEEMIFAATQLACAELLLSGCTTSADHHYIFPPRAVNAMDAQVAAVREIGMRATLTRGCMSLGENDGGLPPQNTVQTCDAILKDCARVIEKFHSPDDAMLQIALAPCSPFSVSADLMREVANLARAHKVRLHTHLAETADETAFCLREFGARPLDYLEEVGWLADDVWLAHGIHFNDAEIARLGNARVGVAHCPSSNMALASGKCKTLHLENAGAPVSLGVDGSASNDCSNMMQEVRQAMLLQKLHYGAARVGHLDALRWATAGGAACLGRSDIGAIAVGARADLAFFSLADLRFSGAADALAALVLCGAHEAHSVMVGGEWKVAGGELIGADLGLLRARHAECARRLWGIGG